LYFATSYKIDYVSGKMELLKADDLSGKDPGGALIEVVGPKSLNLESRGSINLDSVEVDEQERDPNHDPLHQLLQPVTFILFILRNHNSQ